MMPDLVIRKYAMNAHAYLVVAILSEVAGTLALKSSDGFTRLGPSLITIAGYAVAFYFLSLALRGMSTGAAYAIWSGVGIVLIATLSWLLHGQKLDAAALIGMGLIVAGVLVLNLFSRTTMH